MDTDKNQDRPRLDIEFFTTDELLMEIERRHEAHVFCGIPKASADRRWFAHVAGLHSVTMGLCGLAQAGIAAHALEK